MSRIPGNFLLKQFAIIPLLVWVTFVQAQVPVANFTASATSGCSPLKVTFSDQSTGNPTSWDWDFGNGQLSTVQNPTVSYAQPGTYTVTLVVK
ncbi:MAG: PKD domain-containing protein, partial [Chitinophagales bacterium]